MHTKFVHSGFGDLTTEGLKLEPAEDFGHTTQMRNVQLDAAPEPGWQATWIVEDRYDVRENDTPVGLHYQDFTNNASASRVEGWVVAGSYNSMDEAWINRLMIQRHRIAGQDPDRCHIGLLDLHSRVLL